MPKIEPFQVIQAVEDYVRSELADAANYDNRQPLDESGIWSLHDLAAQVYALGHADGAAAESARMSGRRDREREAAREEAKRRLADGVSAPEKLLGGDDA